LHVFSFSEIHTTARQIMPWKLQQMFRKRIPWRDLNSHSSVPKALKVTWT
jgi:hypothetical protein